MGGNSESISSIAVSGFVSLLDETPNLSITEVSEDLLAAITVKVIDVIINAIANIQVTSAGLGLSNSDTVVISSTNGGNATANVITNNFFLFTMRVVSLGLCQHRSNDISNLA